MTADTTPPQPPTLDDPNGPHHCRCRDDKESSQDTPIQPGPPEGEGLCLECERHATEGHKMSCSWSKISPRDIGSGVSTEAEIMAAMGHALHPYTHSISGQRKCTCGSLWLVSPTSGEGACSIGWKDAKVAVEEVRVVRAELQGRIDKALELHREFKIYDECDHDHRYNDDGTLPDGVLDIDDLGLTCLDAYMYSICSNCCTGGSQEWQQEACANDHRHDGRSPCWPCPTRAALEGRDSDAQ